MKLGRQRADGRWVFPYTGRDGLRHEPTFKTRADVETFVLTELPKLKRLDSKDSDITVGEYIIRVLSTIKPTVDGSSYSGYESVARVHIMKDQGALLVRDIEMPEVFRFLASKLETKAVNTVRRIRQMYGVMFDWAIEEKIHPGPNPVTRAAKKLKKLKINRKTMARNIKAMDVPQLQLFLDTTREKAPDLFPLFVFMARNGLRPGEAYGAGRANLSLEGGTFLVDEALCSFDNEMGDTKTDGSVGEVQLTPQTVSVLKAHISTLPVGGRFLFPGREGKPHDHGTVNRRMKRILALAPAPGLPLHFTPHCLRHTYASQSIAAGENISFVQQQLRHASITLTADLYGKWLPKQRVLKSDVLDVPFKKSEKKAA